MEFMVLYYGIISFHVLRLIFCRLRPGIVVFNYRDYTNMLTKTEGILLSSGYCTMFTLNYLLFVCEVQSIQWLSC